MISIFVTWLVTTISFLILARIPFLGIEIDSLKTEAIAAAVINSILLVVVPPFI